MLKILSIFVAFLENTNFTKSGARKLRKACEQMRVDYSMKFSVTDKFVVHTT